MGKPKNKGKSQNMDEDSDTELVDQPQEEMEQPASKPSKKEKKKKKKDDDWEADVASELASLSLEANEGMPEEEPEEEPPAPAVNKKEKKKKKKQKDDDEDDDDLITSSKKASAFNMLMMDDDDGDNAKSESDNEKEETKQEVQESTKQQKKKDKKKKDKKDKGKTTEEEDLDAILAEIDKPAEKTGKKGKKGKKTEAQEKEETNDQEAETGAEAVKPEIEKVAPKIVTMEDLEDEEEDRKKKKKKKGKEKEVKEEVDGEEKAEEGGEGEEEEGATVKTAAQKRKEKKEREKKKLADKKKQQAMKKEGKTEEGKDGETGGKSEEATEAGKGEDAEKKGSGDEGEGEEDGKKKKKKKKGEKEKEEKVKKPNARIKAMQEILKKQKEEEERLEREEEERIKKEEEAIAAAIEKKRLEEIKKEEKKERQRLKREQLKAEGKLLTAKQKEDRKRAMEMLEMMKAQGLQIPDKEEVKKKRPVYEHKKKKQQKKEDTPGSEETPSPTDTPASTPMQEDAPEIETKEETKEEEQTEAEEEDVKDEWDASSEEEEEEEKESSPEAETKIEVVDKKESEEQEEEEEESEEEESDEEEEEEESEEESESDDEGLTPYERAEQKIKKHHDKCEANRTTDKLRAPVVCVLGHVDTGKTKILDKLRRTNVQDGEAGGITQQIGATNVPAHAIMEKTTMCKDFHKKEMKVPGLLIIDTPGHESFSNLRSRGSSLCDIAILVIDIMHGLEPQTIESINLLKERKTPFVVALNKIDRLYQWKTNPNSDVMNTIKKQTQMCKQEFDERKQVVITQLAEQSLNAALFYENKNPKEYVSLVPTSAHTGDGMGNLLSLICDLTQTWLAKKISFTEELHATVMEVKALPGLGTTIDVILVNGKLIESDHIVLAGTEGPIVTQIRGLLMPQPMRELRVKSQYEHHKEVMAAQGVKIIGKDLEKALAGLPLYVAHDDDEIEYYKEELSLALKDVLSSIKLSERGVFVQASTLGSLEALLEFLRTSKIPYAGINIGPVHKRDIMKASIMLEHDAQWATILAFDVKVERDAQEMAEGLGVNIFTADIIYHLQDKFLKFREDLKKKKKEEFQQIAVFPCKLRVLPQHIFNKRDPIVIGVVVEAGVVKLGAPICVPSKEFVELGLVTSIEVNHKPIDAARRGQEVCIKIENIPGETPKLFGRHFDHTDMLISKISRNSIDAVKDYFRDEMTKQDWTLMVELKKLFHIL